MKTLVSWSSGKDSAWMIHVLRQRGDVELAGLLTTVNEAAQRVAMHAVRVDVLQAQADSLELPLWQIPIPSPCPNDVYERTMSAAVERAVAEGFTHMAFGDLFLDDIRQYRVDKLAGTGLTPIFPLFDPTPGATTALARDIVQSPCADRNGHHRRARRLRLYRFDLLIVSLTSWDQRPPRTGRRRDGTTQPPAAPASATLKRRCLPPAAS